MEIHLSAPPQGVAVAYSLHEGKSALKDSLGGFDRTPPIPVSNDGACRVRLKRGGPLAHGAGGFSGYSPSMRPTRLAVDLFLGATAIRR